jgi:hypothetical protein
MSERRTVYRISPSSPPAGEPINYSEERNNMPSRTRFQFSNSPEPERSSGRQYSRGSLITSAGRIPEEKVTQSRRGYSVQTPSRIGRGPVEEPENEENEERFVRFEPEGRGRAEPEGRSRPESGGRARPEPQGRRSEPEGRRPEPQGRRMERELTPSRGRVPSVGRARIDRERADARDSNPKDNNPSESRIAYVVSSEVQSARPARPGRITRGEEPLRPISPRREENPLRPRLISPTPSRGGRPIVSARVTPGRGRLSEEDRPYRADDKPFKAEARPTRATPVERPRVSPSTEGKGDIHPFGTEGEWCLNLASNKIEITKVTKTRSNCVVVFVRQKGVIDPKEAVVKITFKDTSDNNSFSIERKIYKYIVPQLLEQTPHLVKFVDEFVCDRFINALTPIAMGVSTLNKFDAAAILGGLVKISQKDRFQEIKNVNQEPIYALFTEKAKDRTINDWITSYLYTRVFDDEKRKQFDRNVLLQVAHTLVVMGNIRMRHNDLHTENVFCEEIEEVRPGEKPFFYKLNGKDYSSIYFTRIFDYDHACIQGDPEYNNTYLDNKMCLAYGECNEYIPKWDWFTFLDEYQTIIRADRSLPEHWKIWFPDWDKFTPNELLANPDDRHLDNTNRRVFRGRPCFCDDPACNVCIVDERYLNRLPSPEEFIRNNY